MFGLPSPGQLVSGIGNIMQNTEAAVSNGLNNAVHAIEATVEGHDVTAPTTVTVIGPNGQTGTQQIGNVVSRQEFDKVIGQIHDGFNAVRDEFASIRIMGPTGDGSNGFYEQQEGGGGGGGSRSRNSMNQWLPFILLNGSSTLSTTSLLLLTMGDGGDMDPLEMMLALGLI